MTRRPTTLPEVLDHQRAACARMGSTLYADLLGATIDDVAAGGPCAAVLRPHEHEAFGSVLALRFLGALHWLVLAGRAPALAAHYPSAGGVPGPTLVADFLATVAELAPDIEARIDQPVQTNEVGRCRALVGGYVEVARRSRLPLRALEVGASAGLNLYWDRYWYDTGASTFGDPASGVRFVGGWRGQPPELGDVAVTVAERAGCDRSPLDPTTEDGQRTLRSYVWPDQVERLRRLSAAFEIVAAAPDPAPVEDADLGAWAEDRLAAPVPGVATVVVHSIVWQYVGAATRDRLRQALGRAGEAATPGAPVAWLRMEPAGPVADVRLTWWPGGTEDVLATTCYQGDDVRWGAVG